MPTSLFRLFTEADRNRYCSQRPGEVRVGEAIPLLPHWGATQEIPEVKYVILGIPESIGPQANWGKPGAEKGWEAFLSKYLNMATNRYQRASTVAIAGTVVTEDLQEQVDPTDTAPDRFDRWQSLVAAMDERVSNSIQALQLPPHVTLIVIGGGHNNAYPIMEALGKGAAVANVDPHADFRTAEGRHSGNPFRYAYQEGYLQTYVPVGLHKAYNNDATVEAMLEYPARVFPRWWDEECDMASLLDFAANTVKASNPSYIGLEMDMDVLCQMPSSAYTPEGVTPREARYWMRQWPRKVTHTRYVHLPEAAPKDGREFDFAGKMLAYLVSDFIMAQG